MVPIVFGIQKVIYVPLSQVSESIETYLKCLFHMLMHLDLDASSSHKIRMGESDLFHPLSGYQIIK